ncbi:hypothetical protein BJ742DRAFT_744231 [Cladochytrium replicatum]|nr:hypothetical protein BJ742DRAFT_744231 [Cladochytrium replicatum]
MRCLSLEPHLHCQNPASYTSILSNFETGSSDLVNSMDPHSKSTRQARGVVKTLNRGLLWVNRGHLDESGLHSELDSTDDSTSVSKDSSSSRSSADLQSSEVKSSSSTLWFPSESASSLSSYKHQSQLRESLSRDLDRYCKLMCGDGPDCSTKRGRSVAEGTTKPTASELRSMSCYASLEENVPSRTASVRRVSRSMRISDVGRQLSGSDFVQYFKLLGSPVDAKDGNGGITVLITLSLGEYSTNPRKRQLPESLGQQTKWKIPKSVGTTATNLNLDHARFYTHFARSIGWLTNNPAIIKECTRKELHPPTSKRSDISSRRHGDPK